MGEYSRLKCPYCGYEFQALFGNGASEEPDQRARVRLEMETATDEVSQIYALMKQRGEVSVVAYLQPFVCKDCREFFNYWQVALRSEEGHYAEDKGICPTCGKVLSSRDEIRQDDVDGKAEFGKAKCRCSCPVCHTHMQVTGTGYWK